MDGEAFQIQKIRQTDCKELIRDAKNNLRRASYQLSTLITDGEMNVQIFNGVPHNLELLENLPTYVKILSKKESAPAKVTLDYCSSEDIKHFRMKVYVSYNDASPSKKNHTFKFINKKTFNLYPLDSLERKFKSEHIYFSLESIYGCSVTMKVEFSREQKQLVTPEKQAEAEQDHTLIETQRRKFA